MIKTKSYAALTATSPLSPFEIQRRNPGPEDVQNEILYCGVCHSDLHTARNEWKNTIYPSVPGHEIVGRGVSSRVIWPVWAAWSIVAGIVIRAMKGWSNIARAVLPGHTTAWCLAVKILMAVIPRASP